MSLAGRRSHCRFLNDAHRKRYQRQQDRLEPDRVADRRLVLLAEAKAPPPVRCKCDPLRHLVDEGMCFTCGKPRGLVSVTWWSEAREVRSRQLAMHARAPHKPRTSDGKRHPKREFIDESIIGAVAA